MGIFDIFRRTSQDLTREWVAGPSSACDFCLDQATLTGVGLNDPFDRCQWLGPAEGRSRGKAPTDYYYFSKGLQISETDGTVDHFVLEFYQKADWLKNRPFQPFSGRMTFQCEVVELSPMTTPDQLVTAIGEPNDHREEDGESLSLRYNFNDTAVSFEFVRDEQGTHVLHAVLVT
jgi:hypothetical protein